MQSLHDRIPGSSILSCEAPFWAGCSCVSESDTKLAPRASTNTAAGGCSPGPARIKGRSQVRLEPGKPFKRVYTPNWPNRQPVDQSPTRPVNVSTNWPVDQLSGQSTSQSTNRPAISNKLSLISHQYHQSTETIWKAGKVYGKDKGRRDGQSMIVGKVGRSIGNATKYKS